jgi:hypothetical protein
MRSTATMYGRVNLELARRDGAELGSACHAEIRQDLRNGERRRPRSRPGARMAR